MKPFALTSLDTAQRRRTKSGDDTEAFVAQLNEHCLLARIARIIKLPTPYRVIGTGHRKGSILVVPAEKSGCDYRGRFIGIGREIVCEAKRLTEDRLTLSSRLPQHQRDDLENADREGAVAVLLVIAGETLMRPVVYATPWAAVRARINAGAKSLGIEDLAPHHVANGTPWLARWARRSA